MGAGLLPNQLEVETGATSTEAGLLPNQLEVDLPPCKFVEASMEVDGSRWKPVWK